MKPTRKKPQARKPKPKPARPPSGGGESMVLGKVTRELVATYDKPWVINHLRDSELPDRDTIIDILSRIKDLMFPDHRLEASGRRRDCGKFIGGMLTAIERDLYRQILLARAYTEEAKPSKELQALCRQNTHAFLLRMPELRQKLADDARAAYEGDPAAGSYDEIIYCYPGFEAVSSYRIAHELHKLRVPLLPRIMTEHAHSLTGCDIHPGASIGHSFFIDHATGVVIGATAILGDRVKLYQGVTLGALSFSHDADGNIIRTTKRHPTIENGVVIYAGATVLGGMTTIGEGSVIGGSCWITKSIPPHTKVMLSEPQMRMQNGGASPAAKKHPRDSGNEWCI